ncbi:MAG: hypothetical protein JSV56_09905 [Methanomassiliicoccales archaeon]|nr:MAG: hypothetical protein JSV56_09905 [Methanomassiliicoccales archaeon]
MIGEFIYDITGGNIILLLLGAFFIFYFDAMVLTILPEVLILFFFATPHPGFSTFTWMILLIIMATLGDVSGNYTVYLLFKKVKRYHNWVYDKLRKYVGMLVLKDEKLILLNRVAPALPMCGAFMAACNWNVKKSLFYIWIGGAVKYFVILLLFGFFDLIYDTDTAFWITFISVVVFLIISFFLGRYERKKLMKKAESGEEQPDTDES